MTENIRILNFVATTTYVKRTVLDRYDPSSKVGDDIEVPCLRCGDTTIFTMPIGTYWDAWGDGGPSLEDVVVEELARRLASD